MHRRTWCEKRQVDMAKAILRYENAQGEFPGYCNVQAEVGQARVATGWVFSVLPYFAPDDRRPGYRPLAPVHKEYGPNGPAESRGQLPQRRLPELLCPDNSPRDKEIPSPLAFVVNSGLPDAVESREFPPDWPANGVFLDRFSQPQFSQAVVSLEYLSDHDGAETTLLLSENIDAGQWADAAEAQVAFVWAAHLADGEPDPQGVVYRINRRRGAGDGSMQYARPSSHHAGGVNAVMCDGRSQFVNQNIDYLVFCRLMTPDGAGLKQPGSDKPIPPPFADLRKSEQAEERD
jgi:prepilin-type processing-associated H-X9-DG protein